jgi:hypothetical protein
MFLCEGIGGQVLNHEYGCLITCAAAKMFEYAEYAMKVWVAAASEQLAEMALGLRSKFDIIGVLVQAFSSAINAKVNK